MGLLNGLAQFGVDGVAVYHFVAVMGTDGDGQLGLGDPSAVRAGARISVSTGDVDAIHEPLYAGRGIGIAGLACQLDGIAGFGLGGAGDRHGIRRDWGKIKNSLKVIPESGLSCRPPVGFRVGHESSRSPRGPQR